MTNHFGTQIWYIFLVSVVLLLKQYTHDDNDCSYVLAIERKNCSLISDNSFTDSAQIEMPFYTHSSDVFVIGSCDGLVCLSRIISCQYTREVFLWNPSIRKFKNLGSSDLILKKSQGDLFEDFFGTKVFVGFGYCEKVNDYRVVRIVYFKYGDKYVSHEVEVYSFVSDSWRRIEVMVPSLNLDEFALFYNGALHWLGLSEDYDHHSILSFDLNDETCGEIMLPQISYKCLNVSELMEFKGLLSLFTVTGVSRGSSECCVWTTREYGDGQSWAKQVTILFENVLVVPFGFTKRGKLVYEDESGRLHWYDPESLQTGILASKGLYSVDVSYKESLLLLDEGKAPVCDVF